MRQMKNFFCNRKSSPRRRASFTLIELLVVLAIVAILSVVVIMTLNPSELLKQARDSNRLSDLSTLNTALSAYSADVNGGFMGTSSVVYVSIPDTTSTCANLGLPTLPTGWSYNCVTSTSTKLSNGQGWIPVNFGNISFGSPLSSLPVDPSNTTTSLNYYIYVSGGSYALGASLESQKYLGSAAKNDGGYDPGTLEVGNNLSLISQLKGLAGWWDFEEGSGIALRDRSGNGNDGVWSGSGTHYIAGKDGGGAGQFNAGDDAVQLAQDPVSTSSATLVVWMYATSLGGGNYGRIANNGQFSVAVRPNNRTYGMSNASILVLPGYNNTFALNKWEMVAFTRTSAGLSTLYVNGAATGPYNQKGGPLSPAPPHFILGIKAIF